MRCVFIRNCDPFLLLLFLPFQTSAKHLFWGAENGVVEFWVGRAEEKEETEEMLLIFVSDILFFARLRSK